jgi:hypothetical protein
VIWPLPAWNKKIKREGLDLRIRKHNFARQAVALWSEMARPVLAGGRGSDGSCTQQMMVNVHKGRDILTIAANLQLVGHLTQGVVAGDAECHRELDLCTTHMPKLVTATSRLLPGHRAANTAP